MRDRSLRVALVVGSLTQGGAEKQALYLTRGLLDLGAEVRAYTLTRGDYYEPHLSEQGVQVRYIGGFGNPAVRALRLLIDLRRFRPHVVQSTHFFASLYAAIGGRARRAIGIGAVRNDVHRELEATGRWGPILMRMPTAFIANSMCARRNAEARGYDPAKFFFLPNVIDLEAFDAMSRAAPASPAPTSGCLAILVANPRPAKRIDRFLRALQIARRSNPEIHGVVIGDGPTRSELEREARELGLLENGVRFLGTRTDAPALLRQADMFVLTSEHEGFPNVLLEAMAARLPVITTPAGDAGDIVEAGSGFVLDSEDGGELAAPMLELAASARMRSELGNAGRSRVERSYDLSRLGGLIRGVYASIGEYAGDPEPGRRLG